VSRQSELEAARLQSDATNGSLSALLALDDYAMVSVSPDFTDLPYAKYASSAEGLRRLILDTLASFPDADLGFLEGAVAHEAGHDAAARAVGCTTRFAFSVIPVLGGWQALPSHGWVSEHPLTKLAIAAIAAAPACLSVNDLANLHCMGYRDAQDVADRIREYNRWVRHPLPVPTSQR
jgi:hypothetical protein